MYILVFLHYHYKEEEEEVKEPQCAHPPPLDNDDVIGSNHCLCMPKAELITKNFEFLVFNSIHYKKGDAFNIEDRVEDDVICGWPLRCLRYRVSQLSHKPV